MRTEIVFQPATARRWQPIPLTSGYATAHGLVLHRSLCNLSSERGYWDVSDPETGCLVAYGTYPGIEGAVAGLVEVAMPFAQHPGGFAAALADGRRRWAGANT